jgi:pimeloyl-ACP methyl ester carboxylesterase
MFGAFAVALTFLVYLFFSPRFSARLYRFVLFHPLAMSADEGPPVLDGVPGLEVVFGEDISCRLVGWFYRRPGARFVMLVSHGNGGNIAIRPALLECILRSGCSVFIYDYCGYGKSAGLPDLQNIVQAGESAYRYLINNQGYQPGEIIVYGESLGTAVSACLAESSSVAGLVIQSGFSSLYKIAVEKLPLFSIYPPLLFPAGHFDTLSRVKNIKVPVLIVHGTLDPVVPVEHGEAIYAVANQPKSILVLNGAHHTDISELYKKDFVGAMNQFVASLDQTRREQSLGKRQPY